MRLDWRGAAVYDCARFAGVAQLVEQRIRNAQVMGSSPFTGSRHFSLLSLAIEIMKSYDVFNLKRSVS